MDRRITKEVRVEQLAGLLRSTEVGGVGGMALAIIETLVAGTDVRNALHEFVKRASEAFGAESGSLLVRADEPGALHVVASSDTPAMARVSVRLDRYPEVEAALKSTEPLVVEDAPNHPLLREVSELVKNRGIGSLLVFPIIVEGFPKGVLLFRRSESRTGIDAQGDAVGRLSAAALGLALASPKYREAIREQTNRILVGTIERERRLRALARYRDLFESASDGTVVVDASGNVLYLNRAGELLSGYSREGLTGQHVTQIVDELHRTTINEVLKQAVSGARFSSFDVELKTTSGDPMIVSTAVSALLSDANVVILQFRDVTQARTLEIDLRRTKEFLEKLIDSAADAIVASDAEGTILLFNKAAEQLFGYSADEVVGQLNTDGLYPPGRAFSVMEKLRGESAGPPGRLQLGRQDVQSKTGEVIPVSLSAARVYEGDEEVATIAICSDLRERLRIAERLRHAQEKLEISEKQVVVAELAGATAHELNQPLTSIVGYGELLQRKLEGDDRRIIDTIVREAGRMAEIVRKIGQITRYETKGYVGGTQILDLDKATDSAEEG